MLSIQDVVSALKTGDVIALLREWILLGSNKVVPQVKIACPYFYICRDKDFFVVMHIK